MINKTTNDHVVDDASAGLIRRRMIDVMENCDEWASYTLHMRGYWNSLDDAGKKARSEFGKGLVEMEASIAVGRCRWRCK